MEPWETLPLIGYTCDDLCTGPIYLRHFTVIQAKSIECLILKICVQDIFELMLEVRVLSTCQIDQDGRKLTLDINWEI